MEATTTPDMWHTMHLKWSTSTSLLATVYLQRAFFLNRYDHHMITYEVSYESSYNIEIMGNWLGISQDVSKFQVKCLTC